MLHQKKMTVDRLGDSWGIFSFHISSQPRYRLAKTIIRGENYASLGPVMESQGVRWLRISLSIPTMSSSQSIWMNRRHKLSDDWYLLVVTELRAKMILFAPTFCALVLTSFTWPKASFTIFLHQDALAHVFHCQLEVVGWRKAYIDTKSSSNSGDYNCALYYSCIWWFW